MNSKFIITKIEELITLKGKNDIVHFWHYEPLPIGFGKVFFYFLLQKKLMLRLNFFPIDSFKLLKKGYNNILLSKRSKKLLDFSEA